MTSQLELTKDERIRILRELAEPKCFCGAKKAMMQAFCRPHYSSLPKWMRDRLYQRAGDGYEDAYTAAREYFAKADVA
jgi:hypothetical protein